MQDNIVQDKPASHSQPQETIAIIKAPEFSQPMEDTGPVPLSFPSILRHPGLTSCYAHLINPTGPPAPPAQAKKVWRRNDNEGKRWVRRRENGTSRQTILFEFVLLNTTTTPCVQLASRTTHTSRRRQSAILSLPCPSFRQHFPSPSRRISRAVRRSPRASYPHRTPRRAAQDSSASPYVACARRSAAPAPAQRLSSAASRTN